jgi:acyl-CoA thioesterase FadM
MHAAGLDPHGLQPVAERLTFRAGVVAGDPVVVRTQLVGTDGADAFVKAQITNGDGKPYADGLFVRRHVLDALR